MDSSAPLAPPPPGSTSPGHALAGDIAVLEDLAARPAADAAGLAGNIAQIHRQLLATDFARYDLARVKAEAVPLRNRLFALRQGLRERIPGWHALGLITPEAERALRDVFRAARYAADMLGEIAIGHARLEKGEKTARAFTGSAFDTQLGPALAGKDFSFQSGDVAVVRGQLHNSAAIAHIGAVDGLFSHAALVHVDAKGRRWAVESLIEYGAVVNPLDSLLDHNLGRAVVYRHRDAALAAEASRLMYDHVVRSRRWWRGGRRILYDFTAELDGYETLYCSKLIRQAYEMASGGQVRVPVFPTRFDSRNKDFLDRIGITAARMFAPSDMDLEPDFDLVAEWEDCRVTSDIRLQDMGMIKLFEWMEERGYVFREDVTVWLLSVLGRAMSRLPEFVKRAFEARVPPIAVNMSRRTIATIAMLHWTAEPLFRRMQKLEDGNIARTGRPLHPREILAALEEMREAAGRRRVGYLYPPKRKAAKAEAVR